MIPFLFVAFAALLVGCSLMVIHNSYNFCTFIS